MKRIVKNKSIKAPTLAEINNVLIGSHERVPCLHPDQVHIGIDGMTLCFPAPEDTQVEIFAMAKVMLQTQALEEAYDRSWLRRNHKKCMKMRFLHSSKARVTICLGSKKPKAKFFYLHVNPDKMSSDDWDAMHSHLAMLTNGKHIIYMKQGHFSRVDLYLDVHEMNINSFLVEVKKAPKFRVFGHNNRVETLYFGSTNSRKQYCIYDKYTQLRSSRNSKAKKKDFSHDEKTRFELRLTKQKIRPKELKHIPLQLNNISATVLGEPPNDLRADEVHFIKAVCCDGLHTTIRRYKSDKSRKKWRNFLTSIVVARLDFELLMVGWPSVYRKARRHLFTDPLKTLAA